MAAAYAELGRFQEAVTAQEEAIRLIQNDESGRFSKEKTLYTHEKYLTAYKAGKPWRKETEKTAN